MDADARREKIARIRAVTIPDYPPNALEQSTLRDGNSNSIPAPTVQSPASGPVATKLFRYQYGIREAAFTLVQSCVDFVNDVDNLVLERVDGHYRDRGTFVTEPLTLPPGRTFRRLCYRATTPPPTTLGVNVLDLDGSLLVEGIQNDVRLNLKQPVRLEFQFATGDPAASPALDEYSLVFD